MKNRKEMITSNIRKCGYLKVGRSLLKAFFLGNAEERQLSAVWLCVQTFAYFSEGQVCTNDGTYICRPGEWITCYTEISKLTGLDRRIVKARLKTLEQMGILVVEHLLNYKRLSLVGYAQEMQTTRTNCTTAQASVTDECGTADSLFSHAGSFYSAAVQQEGGTDE